MAVETRPAKPEKRSIIPQAEVILSAHGYNPAYLGKKPLGRGVLHKVFLYTPPEGKKEVIKIPVNPVLQYLHGEEHNVRLVKQYFSEFMVPTRVLERGIIAMDYVEGKPLSTKDMPKRRKRDIQDDDTALVVRSALERLVAANKLLMQHEGLSLDILGSGGAIDLAGGRIIRRNGIGLSSIFLVMTPEGPQLKITDTDLVVVAKKEGVRAFDLLKGQLVFRSNRQIVKRYFHIDMAA